MTKHIVALAAAALTILSVSASQAKTPMMHGKMPAKSAAMKGVYVCKMCKAYYSPAQAKTMGYKDPMGHKLTMMSKAPAGYAMGGGKMGGMKKPAM